MNMNKSKPTIVREFENHWPMLTAFVIAFLGCNISEQAKSKVGQDFLSSISLFISSHVNFFFVIICILLVIELILMSIRYDSGTNNLEQTVADLNEELDNSIEDTHQKITSVSDGMQKATLEVLMSGQSAKIVSLKQNSHIRECLLKLHFIQRESNRKYHEVNQDAYLATLKKHFDNDDEIESLIDRYCK